MQATKSSLPTVKLGTEVRPRIEGYTERRGVVTSHVHGNTWGVILNGETQETDFAASELTALSA